MEPIQELERRLRAPSRASAGACAAGRSSAVSLQGLCMTVVFPPLLCLPATHLSPSLPLQLVPSVNSHQRLLPPLRGILVTLHEGVLLFSAGLAHTKGWRCAWSLGAFREHGSLRGWGARLTIWQLFSAETLSLNFSVLNFTPKSSLSSAQEWLWQLFTLCGHFPMTVTFPLGCYSSELGVWDSFNHLSSRVSPSALGVRFAIFS